MAIPSQQCVKNKKVRKFVTQCLSLTRKHDICKLPHPVKEQSTITYARLIGAAAADGIPKHRPCHLLNEPLFLWTLKLLPSGRGQTPKHCPLATIPANPSFYRRHQESQITGATSRHRRVIGAYPHLAVSITATRSICKLYVAVKNARGSR